MSTCLLVVDVQRGLVEGPHAVPEADAYLARLNDLVERARSAEVLVVHVQDNGSPGSHIEAGTSGWALVLTPSAGEPVVVKDTDDAFEGTGLADELQTRGVERLVVAGIQSEMCVAATSRGALARGFTVVVPRGAHTTYDLPATSYEPFVPADVVSRVAVWSLGDEVDEPDVGDVRFS